MCLLAGQMYKTFNKHCNKMLKSHSVEAVKHKMHKTLNNILTNSCKRSCAYASIYMCRDTNRYT